MKTRLLFFVLATSALGFVGCTNGTGEVETRHYDLTGFNEVDLSNQGDVVLVTDANSFVEVETHPNLFKVLDLKVDDGELKIRTKKGSSIGKYEKLTYYVHAPSIRKVEVSGSGSISGGGGIAVVDHFEAEVSGSGEISITGIVAQTVEADISGSGNISLSGNTPSAELEVSGSGNVRAFELISAATKARISGSGNIETTTTDDLDVNISGSGNVRYKGTPSINMNGSGSGNLTNAN